MFEEHVARFVNVVGIVLTITLVFVAIISLYVTVNRNTKLGIVGAFIVIFASSVGLLSVEKKVEACAATATYTAMLVVFMSGNLVSKLG
jgi:hypothetical protein